MEINSQALGKITHKYCKSKFQGVEFQIPYFIHYSRFSFHKLQGKATINQIQLKLKEHFHNLPTKTEIEKYLLLNDLGIDCSGFIYNVLDEFFRQHTKIELRKKINLGTGIASQIKFRMNLNIFKPVRRISADMFTSEINCTKIEKVKDIKVGDLIRLTPIRWRGKHIAIIVSLTETEIIYAHSSKFTKIEGPHYGRIEIVEPNLSIEKQDWKEYLKNGEKFVKMCFKPEDDGVFRLKFLNQL